MKLTKLLNQRCTRIGLAAVLGSTLNLQPSTARAQGAAFTYQGVLNDGGAPATGLYDLEFRAFDAASGGVQQGGIVIANDVPVTNGLFTATLDFGSAVFTGPARWLNIAVRPGASVDGYANLLPRQSITAAPYAVYAGSAAASGLTGTLPDARLSGNVAFRNGGNALTGNQSVLGGNVGIGTTSPFTQLANTSVNIYGNDGYGLSTTSLGWVSDGFGYAAGFYNPSPFSGGDGVAIGIAGMGTVNRILDLWSGDSSNSVMVVNGNGRVGIGTNNPTTALQVVGTVTATAFVGDGSGLSNLPSTPLSPNVALRAGGNAFTGNQSVMSGKLGIGTTSPFTQLANTTNNIYGSDGYGLSTTSLGWVSDGFGYAAGFYNPSIFRGGDGVAIGIAGAGTTNRILDLWTGGDSGSPTNSVMVVNGNGNVGIGTNTPTSKLEVIGTVKATAFVGSGSGLTGLNASQVSSGTLNAAQIPALDAATKLTGTVPDARLSANVALRAGGNAFTGNQSVMSGKLGIGTTSPFTQLANTTNNIFGSDGYGLSTTSLGWTSSGFGYAAGFYNPFSGLGGDGVAIGVAGIGTANRILDLWSGDSSNSVMVVNGNGRVGIGTTAPGASLHVKGLLNTIVAQSAVAGGTAGSEFLDFAGASIGYIGNAGGNNSIGWNTVPGDFAIKASSPTGKLFLLTQEDNTPSKPGLVIDGNNVGIGTTTPGAPLDVLGQMQVGANGTIQSPGSKNSYRGMIETSYGNPADRYGISQGPNGAMALYTAGFYPGSSIQFGLATGADSFSPQMTINHAGNVGIGTVTPSAGLHVETTGGINNGLWSYINRGDFNSGSFSGTPNIAIYTSTAMGAATYYAFSDARIKNITGVSSGSKDLNTLRSIEVTDYNYKDKVANGDRAVKKVIAQQVESVYPQAVSKTTGVVPDIFKQATQEDGWVELTTNLKVGERVKLVGESGQGIYEVLETRDDAFRTEFKSGTDKVFVVGREVKDFRNVDYEAISMLNVSATQELARKLDAQETELTDLRAELASLRSAKASLAQTVSDMNTRFARLEQVMNKTTTRDVKDASASADVK